MSSVVELTGVLTLNPGKAERFIALFKNILAHANANEPGTIVYELHVGIPEKNNGEQVVVAKEMYKDQASMDIHMAGEGVKTILEAMEKENLIKSSQIIFTEPLGGRSKI
ncbi:uncharacterized protein MKZ38_006110 [Zalerion maritima]|uniref:ABM domain-containing protein n=1 Tax=Zalerion maritima TaxID=339359 RepID=A0AAD5RXM3_9PEZI|nr:uncharacterized protein MKZ38_006110 [Zalerion maritima]